MGELTNFGFYKPAEGEDGWATQVNNNADLLEDAFNGNKTIPAIDTEEIFGLSNLVYQPTGGSGVGQNAPPASDPWTLDETELNGFTGRVQLANGRWITDGLATDGTQDWDQSPVYIDGEGVWATAIEHVDGTSPTILLQATEGNGGGASDMAIYGAGKGTGTANIVEADGNMIDTVWENLIVRYGGGDALHIESSASGTRIQDGWYESCTGWGIYLSGGTRAKINNPHVVGNDGGQIYFGIDEGNVSDVTLDGGGVGLHIDGDSNTVDGVECGNVDSEAVLVDGFDNVVTNVTNVGADKAVRINNEGNVVSNVVADDPRQQGVFINGNLNTVSNVYVDGGRSDLGSIQFNGNQNRVHNVIIEDTPLEGGNGLFFNGANNNYVTGVSFDGAATKEIVFSATSDENVVMNAYSINYGQITDNGTRNIVNGWGRNNGDPNSTGQWNGHIDFAARVGATIWDTSTTPWTPYQPTPNETDWVAI